jgi:transposase
MPKIKYTVELESAERDDLLDFIRRGRPSARKVIRARILLKADEGWSDQSIADGLQVGRATIERVRKRFVEAGLPQALAEKPRRGQPRKLNGKQEARLIAEVCSVPPAGHTRWTLRLLAERVVALELVSNISHETVRQILKKTNSSHGKSGSGACRPSALSLWRRWKMCLICTLSRPIPNDRSFVLMKHRSS